MRSVSTIGIVNYNTADLTKKLLQSIFDKKSGFNPQEMEIIVLDNGSDDHCQQSKRKNQANHGKR